jgi:hypothetical protein
MRKRTLGRYRHKRKDIIKIDLREINCEYLIVNELVQDKVQWMNFVSTR